MAEAELSDEFKKLESVISTGPGEGEGATVAVGALVDALAAAPPARDVVLGVLGERLLVMHRGKIRESVDLGGLVAVAEMGGATWRRVLWSWALGVLSQVEAEDVGEESTIEQRYNKRTRQPVVISLTSLLSTCLKREASRCATSMGIVERIEVLNCGDLGAKNHSQGQGQGEVEREGEGEGEGEHSILLDLLRRVGCAPGEDGGNGRKLDWLVVLLGLQETEEVAAWLVACLCCSGSRWWMARGSQAHDAPESAGGEGDALCIASGQWSRRPDARVLDALCQLRGSNVRVAVENVLAGLGGDGKNQEGGDGDLGGGILRLVEQCPRTLIELAGSGRIWDTITPLYVSAIASRLAGSSSSDKAHLQRAIGVAIQRMPHMSAGDICHMVSLLTPSGLVEPEGGVQGHAAGSKKRKTASKRALLEHCRLGSSSDWDEPVCATVRACHACLLSTSQSCAASGAPNGEPLIKSVSDGAGAVVRALSGVACSMARRLGTGEGAGEDRRFVADWLELISYQEGLGVSTHILVEFLTGAPRGAFGQGCLARRVANTMTSWYKGVHITACERAFERVISGGSPGEARIIISRARELIFEGDVKRGDDDGRLEKLIKLWGRGVTLLESRAGQGGEEDVEIVEQVVGLMSDICRAGEDAQDCGPGAWVILTRMCTDVCLANETIMEGENAYWTRHSGADDGALGGNWASVVEQGKTMLLALIRNSETRTDNKLEIAEMLLEALVSLKDDHGTLSPSDALRPRPGQMVGISSIGGFGGGGGGNGGRAVAGIIGAEPASAKGGGLLESNRRAFGGAAAAGDGGDSGVLIEKIRRERAASMAAAALKGGGVPGDDVARRRAQASMLGAGADGDVGVMLSGRQLHLLDTLKRCFETEGWMCFVTDALLAHLNTHHTVPSIDQYKELLPKRSCFEYDVYILSRFSESPSLLCVIGFISTDQSEFRRCWQVVRSLLASSLGYWHSIKDNKVDKRRHAGQITISCQLLESMGKAKWLSAPWNLLNEILPSLPPAEIVRVLLAVWETLIRFPPQAGPYSEFALRSEVIRLKQIFIDNIVVLAPYYARFFPAAASEL